MIEGGPKRTLLSFASNAPADGPPRLVAAQTVSSAGRSVMTAVSLDAIPPHVPQPQPSSSIVSSAVRPHRPAATTTTAKLQGPFIDDVVRSVMDEEVRARSVILEMCTYSLELLIGGWSFVLGGAARPPQRSSGVDGSGSKNHQRKVPRLEDAPRCLHFSFVPWRDDLTTAAACGVGVHTADLWPHCSTLGLDLRISSDRAVLLELLAQGTPVTSESDLRSVLELAPRDMEIGFALMERSMSLLFTLLSDGGARSVPSGSVSFSPPPIARGSNSHTTDLGVALGTVCSVSVKLLRRFAATGSAVGVLDSWLRSALLISISEEDMGFVLAYILQLVREADVCVLRWLSHFLLIVPPPIYAVWESTGYLCHLLRVACAACVQRPQRVALLSAALPVVVQLLACPSVLQTLTAAGGASTLIPQRSDVSGASSSLIGLDVDAVVHFAGIVEGQVAVLGSQARRLAELAAELAALVQPLLAR